MITLAPFRAATAAATSPVPDVQPVMAMHLPANEGSPAVMSSNMTLGVPSEKADAIVLQCQDGSGCTLPKPNYRYHWEI
jgi:hypothetical protein